MGRNMNEKLSAFIDGELGEEESRELLSQLKTDKELRAAWDRYHLAGSALRDENLRMTDSGIADRVAKEIASEPQILAPKKWVSQGSSKLVKIAGSLAIAASVAAIAVISLQVETVNQPGQQNVAELTPVAPGDFIRANGTRWSKGTANTEKALNMYLVEHGEFNPSSNFKGMMSYGRIVSYDMIE